MKLNELRNMDGATKNRMRVGRGTGSGKGKTCGRGVKGQKSRTGVAIKGFEGGQMPLYQRLPKRGFNNPGAKKFMAINLTDLQKALDAKKLDASKPVTEAVLVSSGVVRRSKDGVRLLGRGVLKTSLTLELSGASASAVAAVEKAGGTIKLARLPQSKPKPEAKKWRKVIKDGKAVKAASA